MHTRRTGAAAKAGHDLEIEVTDWSGTLELGDEAAVSLKADGGSLEVREGRGGMQSLDDDDKSGIKQSIDEEVLKRSPIEFSSKTVSGERQLRVEGELAIGGATRPVTFDLTLADDGRLTGEATFKQSDFGIKPFSILFGTLKVADEVAVTIDARLES